MSTSGGDHGALQIVKAELTHGDLAVVGQFGFPIPVANPASQLLVPVWYAEQFHYTNATYDFSGAHLLLLDSSGAPLLDPTVQTFATTVASGQAVPMSVRATSQIDGAGFSLGTNGNVDPTTTGPVANLTIQAAGLGYALGDTGHVGGGNNDCTYTVTGVGALGVVTAIHLDAHGSNYDTANNPRATVNGGAQPGVGVGLTVNVTSVGGEVGALLVAVAYLAITPV